jgi:hypothetical protein
MPGKYQIEGVFTLTSELEPEGQLGGIEDAVEGMEDYEDTSSWDSASFTVEGGIVGFTVEANSEDEARDKAQEALDNAYFSEYGNISWEIDDYSISSIECIEEPMNMERAKALILAFIARLENIGLQEFDGETKDALVFVVEELLTHP